MKNAIAPIVSGILMLLSSAAAAQVGYPPTHSPYVDLDHAQEFSLLVGSFHAETDPAAVAPHSGLLVGAHYEWRAGGPAYLIGDLSRMSSQSEVVDPFKGTIGRDLGLVNRPLYSINLGLGLGLTGGKSWHHLVPEVAGGLGFISDLRSAADSGGYKFGTRFAINYGAGIRWVPGGKWSIRADVNNRLYTISYPEAYYTAPTGGGLPVIPETQAKSFWTNNPAFTLGISRLF